MSDLEGATLYQGKRYYLCLLLTLPLMYGIVNHQRIPLWYVVITILRGVGFGVGKCRRDISLITRTSEEHSGRPDRALSAVKRRNCESSDRSLISHVGTSLEATPVAIFTNIQFVHGTIATYRDLHRIIITRLIRLRTENVLKKVCS